MSEQRGRQESQLLKRRGGLATGFCVINQQVLPAGVGHAEPVATEMNVANFWVTHVDDAGAITDIRARPQLTEAWAGQLKAPRSTHATGDPPYR